MQTKRSLPAVDQCDPRDEQGRCQRTDIASGIEYADRQRPFLPRKPLRYRLHCGGKIPRLAESQHYAGDGKTGGRTAEQDQRRRVDTHRRKAQPRKPVGRAVRDGRKAPHPDRQCEADPHPDPVHEPSCKQQANAVSGLERKNDRGVVALVKTKLALQHRLEQSDHLPVDVVDGRGEQQKGANHPAEFCAFRRRGGGDVFWHGAKKPN